MQQLKQADGNQYRAQLKASERGPLFLSGNYVDMVVEGGGDWNGGWISESPICGCAKYAVLSLIKWMNFLSSYLIFNVHSFVHNPVYV